jgi:hypothetical protein
MIYGSNTSSSITVTNCFHKAITPPSTVNVNNSTEFSNLNMPTESLDNWHLATLDNTSGKYQIDIVAGNFWKNLYIWSATSPTYPRLYWE